MITYLRDFNIFHTIRYLIYVTGNERILILIQWLKYYPPCILSCFNIYCEIALQFLISLIREFMKVKGRLDNNIFHILGRIYSINFRQKTYCQRSISTKQLFCLGEIITLVFNFITSVFYIQSLIPARFKLPIG